MDKEKFNQELLDLLIGAKKELSSNEIHNGIEQQLTWLEIKKKVTLDRKGLLNLLSKMLTQVVVLCNHIANDREPQEDYVTEKLSTYPVLDFGNQDVLDRFLDVLEARYGVRLQRKSWG